MKTSVCIYILIYSLMCCVCARIKDFPVVEIHQGILRGKYMTTRLGRTISAFLGVPFASPPVGDLRFKPPIPAGPWDGILNASEDSAPCVQKANSGAKGDENCLYLNIYTPQYPVPSNDSLHVLFFIHGGCWISGTGGPSDYRPDFLLDKDVVLVSTNYRLGALGFLSTGDSTVPGNNGMKDQNFALKWVVANIAHFGESPDSITLFGGSAGAGSVHLHMFSPLSRATSEEMVECLRKVEPETILEQDRHFKAWDVDPAIVFNPVVEPDLDGAFLSQHPVDMIRSGKYANVPWLTGINTHEGALRIADIYGRPHLINEINIDFNRIMPFSLLYYGAVSNTKAISKQIREFYFGNKTIDSSMKQQLINILGFWRGADAGVRLQLIYSKQPVYFYLFGYRGSVSFTETYTNSLEDFGVSHVDDVLSIFPLPTRLFPDRQKTESDYQITDLLTTLWFNFAKTGDPTPEENLLLSEKWTPVQSTEIEYYYIENSSNVGMKKGLLADRARFWRRLPINPEIYEIRDDL